MLSRWVRVLGLLIFVVVLFFLLYYYHANNYLTLEGFNRHHQEIMNYANQNMDKFIPGFILSYVVLIACCVPGTILFDLLAGYLFGIYLGSALVLLSYLSGSIINFLLVKYFLKDLLKNHFNRFKQLVHGNSKLDLFLNLVGLRLIAIIPFWILNIVTALLEVDLKMFILSTFVGIIPTSVIYVVIGEGVRQGIDSVSGLSYDMIESPKIWVSLIVLGVLTIMPNIIKSIKNRHHDPKKR